MTISLELPNGVKLVGEKTEVEQTARSLGFDPYPDHIYHFSQTKGEYVRIDEMHTVYLRNVLWQQIEGAVHDWYAWGEYTPHKAPALEQFAKNIMQDTHFHALLEEYLSRPDEERV